MALDGRSGIPKNARNPGPFEAIVVSHLDPAYSGTLEVELLKNVSSGNQAERSGQIVQVKYLSPFYGTTSLAGVSNNETFEATQKSYGMWFIPPDVGSRVLVTFAEGNFSRGYWIGCVQDSFMNWMTPDPWAGSVHNNQKPGRALPVGEYNKTAHGATGNNPTKYTKPVNTDFYNILASQGLIDDSVRGPSSSSARREVPSSVFGISTPGAQDKRPGAPRAPTGPVGAKANTFTSRLAGQSFVMDDGDDKLLRKGPASSTPSEYADIRQRESGDPTIPANELVRIRTRTGHQILLHNSEDLIYIGNAKGTTWIELTSNGKIDIFAQDSVSVRTSADLNVSADRDINFSATRDINFNAGRDYKLSVGNNSDVKIGSNHMTDVGADYDLFVGANQTIYVGESGSLKVKGAHLVTSSSLDINTIGARKDTQSALDINTQGSNKFTAQGSTEILSGANHIETASQIHMNGPAAGESQVANSATTASVAVHAKWPARVPVHEPWSEHEHLNPANVTSLKTEAKDSPSPALRESSPLIDENSSPFGTGAVTMSSTISAANQRADQQVVPGEVTTFGELPAETVPITELQQLFLGRLISELKLDPASALNSANPNMLSEGQTPGNAEALAMALAQPQAECNFVPRSENLNYSAGRLRAVFPSRVRTDEFAQQLAAAGPAAIANTLYGNRFGNAQDEGYKYRGRGLIQLTFKANYKTYGNLAGVPKIVSNPELVNSPEISIKLAVAYLKSKTVDWNSYDFSQLGGQFRSAVGYADPGGNETARRIGIAKGFFSKLQAGELTPITAA